ncbi:MAG: metalloregulator ArsR/SmtB family transcription factor [Candidatus Promineifilaceae bacterium]|nr:metalloregulator ArsR/SmtB family transcription factor [Candidatus Promineifilaceae bacterium]
MAMPSAEELNLLHANICKALGDPKRIQLLYLLHEEPRHVSALADHLDVPQPTVSRHLAILRERALVTTERDGALVVYSLADQSIVAVLDSMRQILRDILDRQADVIL